MGLAALIDGDDVVQQVAPTAFNPPLRDPGGRNKS
jgi:hypothetical protein